MSCERFREQLAQYIADGEPACSDYEPLRQHLVHCARCQTLAKDLRIVETALASYPLIVAPPTLRAELMRTIMQERQALQEEWRLLPWDVWVPAVAFGLALLIALLSLPAQLWQAAPVPESPDIWAKFGLWLNSLRLPNGDGLFWVIWVGVFATTAGLGLCLSLTNWTHDHTRQVEDLEARVADTVTHLWDQARRAH